MKPSLSHSTNSSVCEIYAYHSHTLRLSVCQSVSQRRGDLLFRTQSPNHFSAWLFIYAGAIPLAIILGWLVVVRSEFQKTHITTLGFFNSVLLTLFVTDVIKNAVGRPRPDLLDRCQPAPGTSGDELVSIDVCTETRHHVLQDGWRSFPSGHSSFAFAGLGYLALFIASQTYVFRPRSDLARFLLVLAPLLGAALIAISRLEDYRHDVFDVVCGSLLGSAIAYSTWRRHYPSLSSAACDTPYAVLTEGNITKSGFSRIRDEEAVVGDARQFELESDVDERYAFAGQRSHA